MKHKWIDVETELPEPGRTIVFMEKYLEHPIRGYYCDDTYFFYDQNDLGYNQVLEWKYE